MVKLARVVDNLALDVTLSSDFASRFHPSLADQFSTVADQVENGWRKVSGVWTAPATVTPEAAPRRRVVDRQTLLASIPANVEFGIREYARTAVDPGDPTYLPRGMVGILLQRVDTAENINLDLPANVAGFNFLVTLGLMTQAQADAVLAGPLV